MLSEKDKNLSSSPGGRRKVGVGKERKGRRGVKMGKKGGKEREGGRKETGFLN